MKPAPLPAHEAERLRVLRELDLDTGETDPALAAIARLARTRSGWPIGAIGLVDAAHEWFAAAAGAALAGAPRDAAFCAHAILGDGPLEVADAAADARFAGHPLVTGAPQVRACAAQPLRVEGQPIGAVCLLDPAQRGRLDDGGRAVLADVATVTGALLEARLGAQRFRLLQGAMEHIPAALMISDRQGRIVLTNKAWRRNTAPFTDGRAATWEALVREMVARGAYPEAIGREEAFVRWRLAVAERPGERHELRFGDLHLLMTDERLDDGSVVHLAVDITARKQAELRLAEQDAQLREAEARWNFALDGAGHGVWDLDDDTGTVFFSPRWKEMLGHAPEEIGTSLDEWTRRIHPEDYRGVMDEIGRHRRGETELYETQHRLRHKNGHWIWVHDRARIFERRADGSPRRVIGTHSDITRQKLADQALRDRQASELASRAKSEFLSRMSHEMRTPLNAVIGFAELLRLHGGLDLGRLEQYSEHILQAGRHLLALVNDVLDLQQVEEGRLNLQLAALPLAASLDGALDMVRPMATLRGIAIESRIDPGVRVRADAQRLRQVLLNVLSNAVKYNRDGGRVCCRLRAAGAGRCALLVEDDGPGVAPQQVARLFQPFERLGLETTAVEGSGLGLIIARRLMQGMHGQLSLASRPGLGTRVRLTLPLAGGGTAERRNRPAPPRAPAPPIAAGPAAGPALRMLYVEDNRINAILFEEAIRLRGGIELRIVEDGDAALALLALWRPEVLVLDAHLPGMSGYELLAQLRGLPGLAGTPAFMCSADAMPEDLERARRAGFAGYWTKPIDIARVMTDLDALKLTAAG